MQNPFTLKKSPFMEEASQWGNSDVEKGQIYTRPEVADFMLTSMGLNDKANLKDMRLLEPSCGEGQFVLAVAKRLITLSKKRPTIEQLLGKILAVELVDSSIQVAKSKIDELLLNNGYSAKERLKILGNWFLKTDFLLEDIKPNFTHVIGNPPYVRVEKIPKGLLSEYRRRYLTMSCRADLYIPFFEKSLSLLHHGGKLSFICTDRWIKNMYGKSLRKFISDNYSLELFVDLYGVDVFEKEVMTYPAITQIAKMKGKETVLIKNTSLSMKEAENVQRAIVKKTNDFEIRKGIANGSHPWLTGALDKITLINKLEKKHPTLEESGCKVFIGAATGANKVYIINPEDIEIEKSRLVPVVTASELKNGTVKWRGQYLINTYDDRGLVNLDDYPKMASYLNSHKKLLCKRHLVRRGSGNKWFKTIDHVHGERQKVKKLLIRDISIDPIVIYDEGNYYPNNSVYYICSNDWDLHALRVVLLSDITRIFISTYSTKIAKGYMRFQAQHLRRLHIPAWNNISGDLRKKMINAGKSDNTVNYSNLTYEMYGLSKKEIKIAGG